MRTLVAISTSSRSRAAAPCRGSPPTAPSRIDVGGVDQVDARVAGQRDLPPGLSTSICADGVGPARCRRSPSCRGSASRRAGRTVRAVDTPCGDPTSATTGHAGRDHARIAHARLDLRDLRRAARRDRRSRPRTARSAWTNASTSAGAASAGRPSPSWRATIATSCARRSPACSASASCPAFAHRPARAAGAHAARQRDVGRISAARRRGPRADRRAGRHRHDLHARTRTSTRPTSTIADAFDARILIPHADRQWIQRPSSRIELFDDEVELAPGRDAGPHRRPLRRRRGRCTGRPASDGRGALLTGDTITVVMDRGWVSFMWSYPNLIPLDAATIRDIAGRVAPLPVRPHLRRLVGAGRARRRARRDPPLGRALRRQGHQTPLSPATRTHMAVAGRPVAAICVHKAGRAVSSTVSSARWAARSRSPASAGGASPGGRGRRAARRARR